MLRVFLVVLRWGEYPKRSFFGPDSEPLNRVSAEECAELKAPRDL